MSLSGIVLAGLIVVVGVGIAVGLVSLVTSKDKEQEAGDGQSPWLEAQDRDVELPPPENAWKPTTWYSEVADGTLFPNQPSASFRISADSSFQRAIARREREDRAANEPTRPYPAIPSGSPPSSEPYPQAEPTTAVPDELEALTQIPTVSMRVVPIKDNLPPTLKMRTARPARPNPSAFPLGEQHALQNGLDTTETGELVKNWPVESLEPAPPAGTPVAAAQMPETEEPGAPAPIEILDQNNHGEPGIEAFTAAIHLDYFADLDAIAISFTECSIRNSSDVPEVFQTINQKLEQILAAQQWHQRALLLDTAGLQVAAEAQIAWELVLDGFVSQSCPEVAANRVLAVQYDSSRPPEIRLADVHVDAAPHEIVQPVGHAGGQLALLAMAQSFDEAVDMVRRMRAGM